MTAQNIQDTSCTKDEAVAIMLGWSDEPIRYRPVSEHPTQKEFDESPMYCLQEDLDDELEWLESMYGDALHEDKKQRPEDKSVRSNEQGAQSLEDMKTAIVEFKQTMILARTYLCAIDDELAKGNSSTLRIDFQSSNSAYTYITLTSLKAWALQTLNLKILPGILTIDSVQSKSVIQKEKTPPRVKMRKQEDAILDEIKRMGFDPKCLPKDEHGKPGIKADVKHVLKGNILFSGKTSYAKTWERLSTGKYIAKMK